MERHVEVGQLEVGMYVVRLDRPWLETPFITQGFPIMSEKKIAEIATYCDYVYINTDEGIDIDTSAKPVAMGSSAPSRSRTEKEIRSVIETDQLPKVRVKYVRQSAFIEEADMATEVYRETRKALDNIHKCAEQDMPIDIEQPKVLIQDLAASVIRNPDGLSWLANLKKQDSYTADHSMNVCLMALVFGRHLGLEEEPLNELGLGALLHDIGKIRTPSEVLNKQGKLTDKEMSIMRDHVVMGRDLLMKSPGVSDTVVDIAYSHHERQSGGGYPRGVTGDRVSLFSKMVAIVDVYDAITSDRCYHKGLSTLDGLQNIYKWRGKHFDPYLAEQFIQCVGTYPIGSIVELSNQDIAIVVSVNQKRRLLPEVLVVLDRDQAAYEPVKHMDLAKINEIDSKITIKSVLPSETHGVRVQDYIFNTHQIQPY